MRYHELALTAAFILMGLTPLRGMANLTDLTPRGSAVSSPRCAVTLAKGQELVATTQAAGVLIEASAVDKHGNRLVVPDPRKKPSLVKRALRAVTRKKPEALTVISPQKAPLDYAYFLSSFRPELEAMIKQGDISVEQLAQLDKRLLTAKKRAGGDEFYVLRLDENPDSAFASLMASSDWKSRVLIFSFEPYKLFTKSGTDINDDRSEWQTPIRTVRLSDLGGTTTIGEMKRNGLAGKGEAWEAKFGEVYQLSNGDRLELQYSIVWRNWNYQFSGYRRQMTDFRYTEKQGEAPVIETLDDVLAKFTRGEGDE